MVTALGSYSATAPVSPSGAWIMQMVAFRTQAGSATLPNVTSVSPNNGLTAGRTSVTISGANFATGATVMFVLPHSGYQRNGGRPLQHHSQYSSRKCRSGSSYGDGQRTERDPD